MGIRKDFHGMRTQVAGTQERLGRQGRHHAACLLRLILSRCSFFVPAKLWPKSADTACLQQENFERDKSPCPPPVPSMPKRKRAKVVFRGKQQSSRKKESDAIITQKGIATIAKDDPASSDHGSEFPALCPLVSGPHAPTAMTRRLEDLDLPRNPLPKSWKGDPVPFALKPYLEESPFPRYRASTPKYPEMVEKKHHENSYWGRPYASQLSTPPRHSSKLAEPTDSPVRVPRMRFMSMLTLNQIANVPISASFKYAKDGYGQAQNAYLLWMRQVMTLRAFEQTILISKI